MVVEFDSEVGVADVILSFGNSLGTSTTDESGRWRKDNIVDTVSVIPKKEGWFFLPEMAEVTRENPNLTFRAAPNDVPEVVAELGYVAEALVRNFEELLFGDDTEGTEEEFISKFTNRIDFSGKEIARDEVVWELIVMVAAGISPTPGLSDNIVEPIAGAEFGNQARVEVQIVSGNDSANWVLDLTRSGADSDWLVSRWRF